MFRKPLLLLVNFLVFVHLPADSQNLEYKVITAVRHGIDLSLDYIEKNLYRSNVDCVLGVAFVRAFMKTAYQNGSHIMDKSSKRLFEKANQIIEKSRYVFENDVTNGNNWKFRYLVDDDIWSKTMTYKKNKLLSSWHRKNPFFMREIEASQLAKAQSSDFCLREIINSTETAQEFLTPCIVTSDCWDAFFRTGSGHGYLLTHKLLLLQVAKARRCLLDERFYDVQVRDICSSVMFESSSASTYGKIGDIFDLFLEQVLLCGYEGFAEFIQNNWLYIILKSQRPTGCFPDALNDDLKSRIKKDMTYFEDGCNDHSTGLGAAVLSFYYHYIVTELSI